MTGPSLNNLIIQMNRWLQSGKAAALSTVVWREGSAPRPVGSKMAVSNEQDVIGSVSGGCVEGALIEESLHAIQDGNCRLVHYGISDDSAWDVGLACGGQIEVQILPVMDPSEHTLSKQAVELMVGMIETRREFFTISGPLHNHVHSFAIISDHEKLFPDNAAGWLHEDLIGEGNNLLIKESPGILTFPEGDIFIDVYLPEPRLFIIGAVHTAIPLVTLAKTLGYYTLVIDPRSVFATHERFPDVDELIVRWPVESMESLNFGKSDFLVLLSHDDKLDLPALELALEKNPRYIGMLSSKTNRNLRFKKLQEAGIHNTLLSQIHAPIGLDLGGPMPEEIALSILAEITAHRYGKCEK